MSERPMQISVIGGAVADDDMIGDSEAVGRGIAEAGADTFVAGSAIFGTKDYKATIGAMRDELAKI